MYQLLQKSKIYQIILGLLIGIIIGTLDNADFLIIVIILIAFICTRTRYIYMLCFVLLGFLYTLHWESLIQKDIHTYIGTQHSQTYEVIEDPLLKDFDQEAILKPDNASIYMIGKFDKYIKLNRGDSIKMNASITTPEEFDSFDRIAYLKSKKIFLELKPTKIISIVEPPLSLNTILTKIKLSLSKALEQNLNEPQATLGKGLIIGDDSNFDRDFKDNLKNSGLSHITSVSGYNVGIIFLGILFLHKFLNRKVCVLISIPLVLLFWQLIGNSNLPTERATLMLSIYSIALLNGRKLNKIYLITLSTLLILLDYPFYLYNVSFQLSLAATLGILILAPKIIHTLEMHRIKNIFTEIIAVTISVLIFTLPISLFTFNQASSLSLLSNLLVLPLIPIVTAMLILGLLLSLSNVTFLSLIIFLATDYLLKFIISVVNIIGSLGFASINDTRLIMLFFLCISVPTLLYVYKFKNVQ